MTPLEGETAVVGLVALALTPWGLIAAGKLHTPAQSRRRNPTQTTAAGAAVDSTPAALAAAKPTTEPEPTSLELVTVGSGVRDKKTGRFAPRSAA